MPTIDNVLKLITQGAGTVNAITATLTPAILADSQCMVIVRSTGVNTLTSVTFQLNGWSVYPVKARGNFAVRASDTGLAGYEMILVFNTTGSYWELLNPATSTILESTTIAAADATTKANAALANANAYTDSVVIGLWDDRGNYDASVNAYPSSGGSGPSGEVRKGDTWTVSVAGTLPTGQVVEIGDVVRALVDDATNTQADWAIQQNNIGYTAENSANKSTDVNADQASNVKYPSVKAVYDWVVGAFVSLAGSYADPSWITSLSWSKITGKATYSPVLIQDTIAHTGVTGETIIYSGSPDLVGILLAGDIFMMSGSVQGSNTANSKTVSIYISDQQASLSNQVLIGRYTFTTAAVNTVPLDKVMTMKTISTQNVVAGTANTVATGTNMGTTAINFAASGKYLLLVADLASAADTLRVQYFRTFIHRAS